MGKKKGSDSGSDADFMDLDDDSDFDEKPKGKGKGKDPKESTSKGKATKETKETKDAGGSKGKPKQKAKTAKEPKMFTAKTPEDLAIEEEGKKLRKCARQIGVIASEREDEDYSAVSKLKPSVQIKKFSQAKPQEIHKKSTHRKNKVLFKFPGLIDLVQEGTFGTLSNMNTNPILDVEFPDGKLRLEGTHAHSKQKFISINPKGKHKTMVAQDVFDHMVVFAKHSWIGKDEKEPSGRDIPESVFAVKHKGVQYAAGAAGEREQQAGGDSTQSTLDSWRVAGDEDLSQGGSQGDCRARRASAAKKIKYTDGDSDFGSGGDASDDADMSDGEAEGTRSPVALLPAGVEVVLKGPAKPRSTPSKSSAGAASKQSNISSFFTKGGKGKAINLDSDEDDDDGLEPSSSQRDKTAPKRESAKKPIKSYKVDSSSAEDGGGSDEESEDEKPKPKKKPAPKKQPAEKKAPAKRKKKDSDEEDDGNDSDVVVVKKSAPQKPAAPKKTPAKKKSKGNDSEEDFDDEDSDEDFGSAKKKPAARKPAAKKAPAPRKAAAPPKKKAKNKGSDDEGSSPPEDDDDDDDWS